MCVLIRLICILFYDQICLDTLNGNGNGSSSCEYGVTVSWGDTILNYILILANVMAVTLTRTSLKRSIGVRHDEQQYEPTRFATCVCFVFTIAFQLCLCIFVVDCVGVSIIWCATFGWLLMCMNTANQSNAILDNAHNHSTPTIARVVAFLDCGTILFYAITLGVITTIAHILAVLMGVLLWKLGCWINKRVKSN